MGMDVGSSSGAMATPNIVPLIDILLVLIIIFMVITPLTPKGLDALVPQPSPNQQQNVELENKTVVVQVLMGGKLKINNEDTTWENLEPRMEQIFKDRAEKVAFVKGDNDVQFMDVAHAIDSDEASRYRPGWPDHRQARSRPVEFRRWFLAGCESPPRRVYYRETRWLMGSGLCGGRGGIVSDVNVVPLIDILLVLLVIFMIMPHRQMGLSASLPQRGTRAGSAGQSENYHRSGRIGWHDSA